ncbi:MAG: endonuclease III [Candidatus Diapherotrites archaeon]|nr:endonuclease III [Candidatus Diapherotrites archaeon]
MQNRVKKILSLLKQKYKKDTALIFSNNFELMVSVILSAQCTDVRVNKVTAKLFKKYKTLEDYCNASQKEFEKDVFQTGFYRNKTKNILATAKKIRSEFNGVVPNTMGELLSLHGVARKSANVILSKAFGKIEGVVVDTHVLRLSKRLGLTQNENPIKVEQDLMQITPHKDWFNLSNIFIWHGRKVCQARKPNCSACELKKFCPSAFKVKGSS